MGSNSIVLQKDQKIIAAGPSVVRYNIDGTSDNTFNAQKLQTDNFSIVSVAIDNNGKVVVAGTTGKFFEVARCNTDGSLDKTFG